MRCLTNRGCSCVVLVFILVNVVVSPVMASAAYRLDGAVLSAYRPQQIPVILIHGLAGSATGWGWTGDVDSYRGLYARLTKSGYTPEVDLFVLDYSSEQDPDYVQIAEEHLDSLIQRLVRQGIEQVDLVGHSYGALIARYYAARISPQHIRKLVLVAAPNHGSYAATALRLQGELDRQLDRRIQGVYIPEHEHYLQNGLPPFYCAAQYIQERVDAFYLPLYREFSRRSLFTQEPEVRRVRETFETWLTQTRPDWPGRLEQLAGLVPEPQRSESKVCPANQGAAPYEAGLTLAYYELLALYSARAVEMRFSPVTTELLRGALQDLEPKPTWEETVVNFIVKRLVALTRTKVVQLAKSVLRSWLLAGVEVWAGVPPAGASVSRLVSERVVMAGTTSALEAQPAAYTANQFLRSWNQEDETANLDSWPTRRALHVIGWASSPWPSLISQHVEQPTDLVVTVEEALLALGCRDRVLVVRDWRQGLHTRLPDNKHVLETLTAFLKEAPEASCVHGDQWSKVEVRMLQPGYLQVAEKPNCAGDSILRVQLQADVEVLQALAAQQLVPTLWWEAADLSSGPGPAGITVSSHSGWTRTPSWWHNLWGRRQKTIYLSCPAGETGSWNLGFRLVSAPGSHADLRWTSKLMPVSRPTLSMLRRVPRLTLHLRLQLVPEEAAPAAADLLAAEEIETELPAVSDGIDSSPAEQPPDDSPTPTQPTAPEVGHEKSPAGEPKVIEQLDSDIPLVRVVYHSKLTTRKQEKRTYHVRWEWDFGDGSTRVIAGTRHAQLEISHPFPNPGTYQVRARSIANDGRLLRDIVWHVEVPKNAADTTTRSFKAQSVVEPQVELRLEGPVVWVTGKPARYKLRLEVDWPEHVQRAFIRMYPAQEFDVRWERPGTFTVRGAVYLRMSYDFGTQRVTIHNTYVTEQEVEVMATTVY